LRADFGPPRGSLQHCALHRIQGELFKGGRCVRCSGRSATCYRTTENSIVPKYCGACAGALGKFKDLVASALAGDAIELPDETAIPPEAIAAIARSDFAAALESLGDFVNTKSPKCEHCSAGATFRIPNGPLKWCREHKPEGAVSKFPTCDDCGGRVRSDRVHYCKAGAEVEADN
jgi:hypothetical protein